MQQQQQLQRCKDSAEAMWTECRGMRQSTENSLFPVSCLTSVEGLSMGSSSPASLCIWRGRRYERSTQGKVMKEREDRVNEHFQHEYWNYWYAEVMISDHFLVSRHPLHVHYIGNYTPRWPWAFSGTEYLKTYLLDTVPVSALRIWSICKSTLSCPQLAITYFVPYFCYVVPDARLLATIK